MAQLEGLSSTELLNFIIYDTISATPPSSSHESDSVDNTITNFMLEPCHTLMQPPQCPPTQLLEQTQAQSATGHGHGEFNCMNNSGVTKTTGSKKRRKRAKVCKNKEEAEAQRMTHITVERNRRKQMNEHLAVLRSLMPDSYAQRGDQATIVGGAIEFVRELEHLLQSLEAQKVKLLEQQSGDGDGDGDGEGHNSNKEEEGEDGDEDEKSRMMMKEAPFAQFFMYPQYTWSQIPNKLTSNKSKAAIADIEVTLIETHASLRILSTKSLRHLSKLVSAFHALHLTILHLSITTAHPLVLYSISAKVEEGCQLSSVDDIAAAVHHMLRIIEDEAICNSMPFN